MNLLREKGWINNYIQDKEVSHLDDFAFMSTFEFMHPNKEYWGFGDPRNINSTFCFYKIEENVEKELEFSTLAEKFLKQIDLRCEISL